MDLSKIVSALSLALALVGAASFVAPTPAKAGNFISFDALKKNGIGKNGTRPGAQANPHTRGCSAITRCRG